MAHGEKTQLRTLQKRGSGMCVVVPKSVLEALGWNRDDALRLDIISHSLVVTRIDLPKLPALKPATHEAADER